MATTAFAPSAASPVSSPQVDSLQPVAASPQISRTSAPMQHSASPPSSTGTTPSSLLSTTSPTPSHLRQRPPYSPNPASRLSTASLSFTLSHRDSFIPQFPSSLAYTSVRDFAYPNLHPLHYGPQPGADTPASSHHGSQYLDSGGNGGGGWFSGNTFGFAGSSTHHRRLSDPAYPSFSGADEKSRGWGENWAAGSRKSSTEHGGKADQLPPLHFEDGPPWSEDPDLHSPVVISTKHRKHRSSAAHIQSSQGYSRRPSKNAVGDFNDGWREDNSTGTHGLRNPQLADISDGEPGGEFHNQPEGRAYYTSDQDTGDFAAGGGSYYSSNQEYYSEEDGVYSEDGEDDDFGDPSRLSNQYFITIASPAEEMHGKAVALFDFQKENENELGLVEGQVIWVSYRHGMGWLVAEDPKTRESGLVPEEYVRLLRDIQQPLFMEGSGAEDDDEEGSELNMTTSNSPPTTQYVNGMKPVVSTFSTSSQDVHPYSGPLHQPGEQAPPRNPSRSGQGGLGSQVQTPVVGGWEDRIEALERARERALMEENSSSYKPRTGSVVSSTGDETPRAGYGGGWGGPRRNSGEIEEGENKHRRKNSRLGFLVESEEGTNGDTRDANADGAVSSKGKERAFETEPITETLPSTSLSPSDLLPSKSDPEYHADRGTGLGIDIPTKEATKPDSR